MFDQLTSLIAALGLKSSSLCNQLLRLLLHAPPIFDPRRYYHWDWPNSIQSRCL